MNAYELPSNIRYALLCLTFLAGMGAGVVAITRRHRTAGILILAGFLLLGLDPLAEIILFRVILANSSGENFAIFEWAYLCLSAPAFILGVGCLIAGLFTALGSKPADTDNFPVNAPGD